VIYLVGLATLQFTMILSIPPNAVRAQYGPCITKVLIDPGHGGTDTSGGYKLGATCWNNLCTERGLNLGVALQLGAILTAHGNPEGTRYWLTRNDDTKVLLTARARKAESLAVNQFISIHHDGNVDTTINRTQMIYCNAAKNDTGAYRDSTSALALKVGYKIRDTFNIGYQSPSVRCDLTVLKRTSMASVVSEASFITNPTEANAFLYGTRAQQEAGAIFHGWRSYKSGGGFAFVHNAYNGGPRFPVHFGVTFWANDRCGSLVKPLTRGGWACVPPEQDS